MRAVSTCALAADTCAAVERSSASESSSCLRDTRLCLVSSRLRAAVTLGVLGRSFGLFEVGCAAAACCARNGAGSICTSGWPSLTMLPSLYRRFCTTPGIRARTSEARVGASRPGRLTYQGHGGRTHDDDANFGRWWGLRSLFLPQAATNRAATAADISCKRECMFFFGAGEAGVCAG